MLRPNRIYGVLDAVLRKRRKSCNRASSGIVLGVDARRSSDLECGGRVSGADADGGRDAAGVGAERAQARDGQARATDRLQSWQRLGRSTPTPRLPVGLDAVNAAQSGWDAVEEGTRPLHRVRRASQRATAARWRMRALVKGRFGADPKQTAETAEPDTRFQGDALGTERQEPQETAGRFEDARKAIPPGNRQRRQITRRVEADGFSRKLVPSTPP